MLKRRRFSAAAALSLAVAGIALVGCELGTDKDARIATLESENDALRAQLTSQAIPEIPAQASAPDVDAEANQEKYMSRVQARHFVEEKLEAPGSAKWPGLWETNTEDLGGGKWRVSGYVDSPNRFGTMMRSNYTCTLHHKGGYGYHSTWYLNSLTVSER